MGGPATFLLCQRICANNLKEIQFFFKGLWGSLPTQIALNKATNFPEIDQGHGFVHSQESNDPPNMTRFCVVIL